MLAGSPRGEPFASRVAGFEGKSATSFGGVVFMAFAYLCVEVASKQWVEVLLSCFVDDCRERVVHALYRSVIVASVGKICGYDAEFPSMYVNVYVGDAFVDRMKALDAAGNRLVDEKADAACVRGVTRASEYMRVRFSGPKFAFVRTPSFINGDDVPRRGL